jgi:hypothetical protein
VIGRLSKPARIALIVLWVVVALFVLADLSEDSRGDPYLTRAIPWDLVAGSVLSVLVLAIDAMVRGMKRPLG